MRGNVHRRLEDLERRIRQHAGASGRASEARSRVREHLDRLAAARRGELAEEEETEVWAVQAALRRRTAEVRGEGES